MGKDVTGAFLGACQCNQCQDYVAPADGSSLRCCTCGCKPAQHARVDVESVEGSQRHCPVDTPPPPYAAESPQPVFPTVDSDGSLELNRKTPPTTPTSATATTTTTATTTPTSTAPPPAAIPSAASAVSHDATNTMLQMMQAQQAQSREWAEQSQQDLRATREEVKRLNEIIQEQKQEIGSLKEARNNLKETCASLRATATPPVEPTVQPNSSLSAGTTATPSPAAPTTATSTAAASPAVSSTVSSSTTSTASTKRFPPSSDNISLPCRQAMCSCPTFTARAGMAVCDACQHSQASHGRGNTPPVKLPCFRPGCSCPTFHPMVNSTECEYCGCDQSEHGRRVPASSTSTTDSKPVALSKAATAASSSGCVAVPLWWGDASINPANHQTSFAYAQFRPDLNGFVTVFKTDITKVDVDIIVNAANARLVGGGGVDGAIHAAAGPQLLKECQKKSTNSNGDRCPVGSACDTKPYRLKHLKAIFHTVGPQGHEPNATHNLAKCYINCLELAVKKNAQSIAFPCISTGVYGFPTDKAARIAMSVVRLFLQRSQLRVVFVTFDDISSDAYKKLLPLYFPLSNVPKEKIKDDPAGWSCRQCHQKCGMEANANMCTACHAMTKKKGVCTKCLKNPTSNGKGWCQECFKSTPGGGGGGGGGGKGQRKTTGGDAKPTECLLPGCTRPPFVDSNGRQHECCGVKHSTEARERGLTSRGAFSQSTSSPAGKATTTTTATNPLSNLGRPLATSSAATSASAAPAPPCSRSGCTRPCYLDTKTLKYSAFCGKTCRDSSTSSQPTVETKGHAGKVLTLFHGTSPANAANIKRSGFRFPTGNLTDKLTGKRLLLGAAVYFSEDTSKARLFGTTVLSVKVRVGVSLVTRTALPDMTRARLTALRCDTVYVEGKPGTDSVVNRPEYAIYDIGCILDIQ